MRKVNTLARIYLLLILLLIPFNIITVGESSESNIQNYYFSVPDELVEVTINLDGSADIEYWITFKVEGSGQDIDIIDIGFPNKHYELSSISADLDGQPLYDIRESEVIDVGVEIHLHSYAISDRGTLHVKGNQPYMVFGDTEESDMASSQFGNTWWGAAYTTGTVNLTTRMVFPGTVDDTTYTKYHQKAPTRTFFLQNGRKVHEWHEPTASPSQQYKYGISFPKEGVKWFKGIPLTAEEIILGLVIGGVVVFIIIAVIGSFIVRRSRKIKLEKRLLDYVPPFVSVPTAGPRTDLPREMVAVILEKPVEITTSMIILSLIEKDLIKPLSEEYPDPQLMEGSSLRYLKKYQKILLQSLRDEFSIKEEDLISSIAALVKLTRGRMKGYSYDKTVQFYESLIDKSVLQITSKQSEDLETVTTEAWYWAVLDENYQPEFDIEVTQNLEYIPWYYTYHYHSWYWVPRGRSFQEKVTRRSYPPPVQPIGRGRGRSGGGGCACACAGCACACAGGGR
ncbi:hypothetical protein CEE45_11730 [Candidatus Heimdallarchaeota archaeon B3_Heim]|nr:MAG: hypothetical protein CEE45_11730 [Candidatus Heimdallarchaeota archaeon B3_Heim]